MIRSRLRNDDGWLMVTAAMLMSIMLAVGLMAMSLVDSDTARTRQDREQESALNLDEGVLYAQSLVLQQYWPNATQPAPATCTSATAVTVQSCPNKDNLSGTNFNNVDQIADTTWRTKVRDDGGTLVTAYQAASADAAQSGVLPDGATPYACAAPCSYDANQNNKVWVQAQSTVRGERRNVVALLQLEEIKENTPETAVTAGALSVTNSGNHGGTPMIDASGSQVIVRCSGTDCVNSEPGQVVPAPQTGVAAPSMLTPDQVQRFKQRAIADGRYYAGCPTPNAANQYDLSGQVVFIEGCASPPNLTNRVLTTPCAPPNNMSQSCINTVNSPGFLIWHCGRADFSGGMTYRGVLYVVNNSDGTCPATLPQRGDSTCSDQPSVSPNDVINTNGGFGVWGSVAVDGPGCLKVGSNGLQIMFDPRVFGAVQSYGTVGLVQNTWRELPPSSFS